MLMATPTRPAYAVGAERNTETVTDCRKRLGAVAGLSFVTIGELARAEHQGKYDAVFCMEVLEHVVQLDPILDELAAVLTPGGRLLVSVPVEIGPAVVVKQALRRIAGWRGIGDYPGTTSYTFGELIRAVLAGPRQHVERPVHLDGDHPFHDHKGFNWKVLRVALERRLAVEALHTSPVSWLPPWLGSQVWISCRRR
jgi:SAM-dependent methyltransferase